MTMPYTATTFIALGLSSALPGLASALCSSDLRVARSPVSYFADTFTPGRPACESFSAVELPSPSPRDVLRPSAWVTPGPSCATRPTIRSSRPQARSLRRCSPGGSLSFRLLRGNILRLIVECLVRMHRVRWSDLGPAFTLRLGIATDIAARAFHSPAKQL